MSESEENKNNVLFFNVIETGFSFITLEFIKKPHNFLQKLFSNESEWSLVGDLTNIEPNNAVRNFIKLIEKELPSCKIDCNIHYFKIFDNTKFHNTMGFIRMSIKFKNEADEAFFIIKADDILKAYKRSLS